MTPLAQRPAYVQSRRQVGHWEGDLIIGAGQRSAIATLVERKTRFTVLVAIRAGHSAQIVGDALSECFTRLPTALRRTLTWDQGNEMSHHGRVAATTGLEIYSPNPIPPGSAGPTKTRMGCCGNTFPRART